MIQKVYYYFLEQSKVYLVNYFEKGRLEEIIKIYKDLSSKFDDNFYLEIQRHGDQNEIAFEKFNLRTIF